MVPSEARDALRQGNVGIAAFLAAMGPPETYQEVHTRFVDAMKGHLGVAQDVKFPKLYDTRQCDNLTAITRSLAIAVAGNWEDYFATLVRLTFRNGELRWEAKNHWLLADWTYAEGNAWIIEEVTSHLQIPTEHLWYEYDVRPRLTQLRSHGISVADEYLGSVIQRRLIVVIPQAHFARATAQLEDGDVLFFVCQNEAGKLGDHLMSMFYTERDQQFIITGGKRRLFSDFARRHDVRGIVVLRLNEDTARIRQTVVDTRSALPRIPTPSELDEIVAYPERRRGPWCNLILNASRPWEQKWHSGFTTPSRAPDSIVEIDAIQYGVLRLRQNETLWSLFQGSWKGVMDLEVNQSFRQRFPDLNPSSYQGETVLYPIDRWAGDYHSPR